MLNQKPATGSYLPIGYLNYYRYFKNILAPDEFKGESLPGIFDRIVRTNYLKGERMWRYFRP